MDDDFIRIREAVRVGVLVPVKDTIAIRILTQGLGSQDVHLNSVAEPVVVGIGLCGIGLVDWPYAVPDVFEFLNIQYPVGVGVLQRVNGAVAVGVNLQRIGFEDDQLDIVAEPIPVGVLACWVGVVDIQFLQVGKAIRVGVFVGVNGAIPVGVLSQRICSQDIHFDAIIKSVLVGVGKRGVGLKADFLAIGQSVLVRVGHLGGCAVLVDFIRIRKTVGIGVLVSVEGAIPVRILHGRVGAHHIHFDSVA